MKIVPMVVDKSDVLKEHQKTAFRRLVMQLRWLAQHVLPEKLFIVILSQRVGTVCGISNTGSC